MTKVVNNACGRFILKKIGQTHFAGCKAQVG
jgi:hypothetical protein